MSELHGTIPHGPATRKASDEKFEYAYALRQRNKEVILNLPNGLAVSSDEGVRRKLGEILRQCGLAPVFASTVAESGIALAGYQLFIVLCDDCLPDGKYVDIVKLVGQSDTKMLVVVVSRTAGWPEYLTAIRAGAFDCLAYPPIPGEFQRIIQNAFRQCGCLPPRRELPFSNCRRRKDNKHEHQTNIGSSGGRGPGELPSIIAMVGQPRMPLPIGAVLSGCSQSRVVHAVRPRA